MTHTQKKSIREEFEEAVFGVTDSNLQTDEIMSAFDTALEAQIKEIEEKPIPQHHESDFEAGFNDGISLERDRIIDIIRANKSS